MKIARKLSFTLFILMTFALVVSVFANEVSETDTDAFLRMGVDVFHGDRPSIQAHMHMDVPYTIYEYGNKQISSNYLVDIALPSLTRSNYRARVNVTEVDLDTLVDFVVNGMINNGGVFIGGCFEDDLAELGLIHEFNRRINVLFAEHMRYIGIYYEVQELRAARDLEVALLYVQYETVIASPAYTPIMRPINVSLQHGHVETFFPRMLPSDTVNFDFTFNPFSNVGIGFVFNGEFHSSSVQNSPARGTVRSGGFTPFAIRNNGPAFGIHATGSWWFSAWL